MLHRIPLKVLIIAAVILLAVLIMLNLRTKTIISQEPVPEANECDVLFLNENLKKSLNVHREIRRSTNAAEEIWLVPNGISIPNYMLRAAREIERCKGKVLEMKEIKNGRALLKYESEQGIYPLTEIRVIDTLFLPSSSKLAVVLAVREKNQILKDKPELLKTLNFTYNLLIPSSREELLDAGRNLNANIIPWVPMENCYYATDKRNQISLGLTTEKEIAVRLDEHLKKFDNPSGFAAFYGEDFLSQRASVEMLGNVLLSKKMWFWDLTKRGTHSLSEKVCEEKELRCKKNILDAASDALIKSSLRTALREGKAILLFELAEKNIALLENLKDLAEKQGTDLVRAEEVF